MANGDTTTALVTAQGGATYVAGATWTAGQLQLACDLANACTPPYDSDAERQLVTTLLALHTLDVQASLQIASPDMPQLPELENVSDQLMAVVVRWREQRSFLGSTRWGTMALPCIMGREFRGFFV